MEPQINSETKQNFKHILWKWKGIELGRMDSDAILRMMTGIAKTLTPPSPSSETFTGSRKTPSIGPVGYCVIAWYCVRLCSCNILYNLVLLYTHTLCTYKWSFDEINKLIDWSCYHWLSLIDWSIYQLIDWSIDWLVLFLFSWLIVDWLSDWMIYSVGLTLIEWFIVFIEWFLIDGRINGWSID